MQFEELKAGIQQRYQVVPDYPWISLPDACVFRHADNRKWFCLFMNVPAHLLGCEDESALRLINVKVPPEKVKSLRSMRGVLPAYHMNKEHWINLLLDKADPDLIWDVLDESHRLTR